MAPAQLLRFSTEMVPAPNRLTAFREQFVRQVVNMDLIDRSDGRPRIDVTLLKLGSVKVGSIAATACDFIRDPRQARDNVDDLQLLLVAEGPAVAWQKGHELALAPGASALFAYGQSFRVTPVHGGSARNIAVPAATLRALVDHPEDRAVRSVPGGPALRLLRGYVDSLVCLDAPPPADLCDSIELHLVDLVAAVIGPRAEAREVIAGRGVKAAKLRAVLADIARRCGDPSLDVDRVAGRLGLSRRSIQRLLEETGQSFTAHLTERRLERTRAMLADPACAHLRIIEIALAAGFGDVSHFNRQFRRRYGETPSDARNAGRERA